MAKRTNNYKRISERRDFKKSKNIQKTLDFLQMNGRLPPKSNLSHSEINSRSIFYYKRIQEINILFDDDKYNKNLLKRKKAEYQDYIINLATIVISSVIKRFKTLYPAYYDDVFTDCVVDILIKIERDKYDSTKSSQASYCYETSYQACIKYLDAKAQYENNTVQLIQ